ncbi:MAG: ABC transporter permease [Candidatus Saccharicenans sp.]|nr:ABC transporter permease [Candidatus Saccharicenans sp.]MDH7493486.1 ABC transporter permease [Candidatus Saccharicenans sp.]
MNLRRLKPVIRKEFIQIRRDPISLTLLLILPAFILVMFGYALNFDVRHLSLAVVDLDRSQASRELIRKIISSEYFDLKYQLESMSEIDPLFDREKIKLAVVIPRNFARDLTAGGSPAIQVLADGTNSTTALTGLGYLSNIFLQYSLKLNLELLQKNGLQQVAFPVDSRVRVWYNPELKSSRFLVPGLMAFVLMIIIVLATALSIVREKEKGTIEQLLLSPLGPAEMIIGKIIPYLLLSLLGAHLVLLAGRLLFGIVIKGSYPVLLLVLVIFLFCVLSQGLLVSTVASSQQVAFLLAGLSTLLPTFILSGFVFPIRNMPPVIQAITYIIPARYFLAGLRAIILKGAGPAAFYREIIFLAGYGLLVTAVSLVRLKKSLAK